jgi:hypothetical protein
VLSSCTAISAPPAPASSYVPADLLPNTIVNFIDDISLIDSQDHVRLGAKRLYQQLQTRTCANGTAPMGIIGGSQLRLAVVVVVVVVVVVAVAVCDAWFVVSMMYV